MPESTQDKLDRVRRPRVQIKYKVETGDAVEVKELPFLVGVLADLSGHPSGEQPPLRDRRFVQIDRDNFNDVMAKIAPRLNFTATDTLSGEPDKDLKVELNFKNMDDFSPERIAEQVPRLRELLRTREKLNELLNQIGVKEKLGDMLHKVLENTEAREELLKGLDQAKGKKEE